MLTFDVISNDYPINLRPFRRNILREYLQYKILQALFNSPMAEKLSFIGGTALRIVHGNTRFSEDLDFDNFGLSREEFDRLAQIVKKSLELEGYQVETKNVYKKAFRCYVRFPKLLFEYGLSPIEEEKILVQFDTFGHEFKYQPEKVILNKFDVFTNIFVTPIDILLSQKIYAAMTRKRTKGRDFFDIVFLLGKTKPNYQYLKVKMSITDAKMLKKRLLSFCREINFEILAKEIGPFLFSPSDNQRILSFPEFIKRILP
ncbi:nucleotidyl transferase AbiEii/AbiGii toxin family protein [Candidatus Collierbacteria bacterium]|nr:nucleotidyl transferase AbiEii/AbiGii toxin family protein [Candidatus Collierbacteria bacterium]